MPISETPISTPKDEAETSGQSAESTSASASAPSNGFASFGRGRYEELDHTDLLHVIEELEGSRNWASLREKLWIALIIHMCIAWYLIYGPKYIYHVHVVDPSVILKQRQKDLTFLDMPKDLMKPEKPKPTNIISDKDRVAQTPHPTLDRKTLEELEAMRRAGPPKPTPAPPEPKQAPAPAQQSAQPQPQVAERRPPSPPAQPLPQNQQSQTEAPPVSAPKPNFRAALGSSNPTEQLQRELQQSMNSGGGQYSGDGGMNAPAQHPGMQGAVDVLSDTQGVDFGPYINQVILETKRAWYPIIPEEARSPINKQGRVLIRFKIYPDGSVRDMVLEGPSGDTPLDKAAWGGITGASPYPPLPRAFHGPYLELRFYFLYNIRPGDQ